MLYDLTPLIFPPPKASTNMFADSGVDAWAQQGRDSGNTSFTPQNAPVPTRVKWSFSTGMDWRYETRSPLVSPPAVSEGHVYVSTEDGRILSLDADTGRTVWQYSGDSPSRVSPVVAGDLVIGALRSGDLIALDRGTGTPAWREKLDGLIYAAPVVADGTVFAATLNGLLAAMDVSDGKRRWSFQTGEGIVSRVAYQDGVVVVVSEGSVVYVVDAATGRRRLIFDTERRRNSFGSAAVAGDRVYFNSDGGIIWAIDRQAITRPLGRSAFYWEVKLYEARVYSEVPIQKGTVWVWRVGGDLVQTPAVGPSGVYSTTAQGMVLARDVATGARLWNTDLGREITSPASVAGDTVLVGTNSGEVLGLDADGGTVKWEFYVGDGSIFDAPVTVGDTIYVVSQDGNLYALSE